MIYEHTDSSNCRCESLAWHKSLPSRTLCPEACGWEGRGGERGGRGGEGKSSRFNPSPSNVTHDLERNSWRRRWIITNARIWLSGCTNVLRWAETAADQRQLIGFTNPLAGYCRLSIYSGLKWCLVSSKVLEQQQRQVQTASLSSDKKHGHYGMAQSNMLNSSAIKTKTCYSKIY